MDISIHFVFRRLKRHECREAVFVPAGVIRATVPTFIFNDVRLAISGIDSLEPFAHIDGREVCHAAECEFTVARKERHIELNYTDDISRLLLCCLGNFGRA